MDRKNFIKTCGFACVGGTALTALLQSCSSTNPNHFAQTALANNQINIKKNEFVQQLKNDKPTYRKYVLVKNEKVAFPIILYRLSDTDYTALLMECTHKGCELVPQRSFLACPCHGSEFNNKGVVQNPPAQENLKSFKIITDNENVYIQL